MENSYRLAYIQDMRRHEVIKKLKETEPALRGVGVAALYLFGSYARDEAKSDSDVDVFVDPVLGRDFGFLPFMDAYQTIQKAFGDPGERGYPPRPGTPLSESETSYGTNTSASTKISFGKSRRFTCPSCSRSWRKC